MRTTQLAAMILDKTDCSLVTTREWLVITTPEERIVEIAAMIDKERRPPSPNGFICADWHQRSEGPILDFTTMARRQVVFRCDNPDGHDGKHLDSVLGVSWENIAKPSKDQQ